MEKLYGVGITNRYSCFIDNEDADPSEVKDTAEKEREPSKKKGKATNSGTAEKENRGKEITSNISVPTGKELPSPTTKIQKQKPPPEIASIAQGQQRNSRKGIRDSNGKGNDARGNNRGGPSGNPQQQQQQQQQPQQQRNAEGGNQRQLKPDRPQGDRLPKENSQGERFQGERQERYGGDRYQGDRAMRFNDDGRDTRNTRRNEENRNVGEAGDYEGRPPRREGGFFRGGDRGRGQNFRGSRGGAGGGSGVVGGGYRKREFDRQSGSDKSGVKPVDKRDGAGSRNWGNYKDDEVDVRVSSERANEENAEDRGDIQEPGQEAEPFEGDETTHEPESTESQTKLMTLDEWKAMQEPREKPVFNLRKAGEGENQSQWNNMTLKKKERDDELEEPEEEYEECHQRAARQKQILDVNFTFADSRRGGFGQRGRPGRGGSGGGRGGGDRAGSGSFERGGRGGYRGGYRGRGGFNREQQDRSPRQTIPNVDDARDFPSLG